MKRSEYNLYVAKVDAFFERHGINNLSLIADNSEGFFSWRSCECCNSGLGGTRYEVNSYQVKTKEILEFQVCSDCYYFAEYGCLDDMTMMDMEEDVDNDGNVLSVALTLYQRTGIDLIKESCNAQDYPLSKLTPFFSRITPGKKSFASRSEVNQVMAILAAYWNDLSEMISANAYSDKAYEVESLRGYLEDCLTGYDL